MKKVFWMLAVCAGLLTACNKEETDVPDLHEKMEGRWQVRSYMVEEYDRGANTTNKYVYTCGPADYMDFTCGKVSVHFDSTAALQWACEIFDYNTLTIAGKKWDIVKLDPTEFQLSLFERDSSLKYRDVVRYELVRP